MANKKPTYPAVAMPEPALARQRPDGVRVGRSSAGLGLFATTPIAKRDVIVEYCGRRIPTAQAQARERRYGSKYMFEVNSRWTIDGSSRRNLARYINHCCRPNAEAEIVRGRILISAIKRIAPGDEITLDYGREYFDLFFGPGGCQCPVCMPSFPIRTLEPRLSISC